MKNNLYSRKILIGVSAGIAIYKVLTLISLLNKNGAICEVIMTENAKQFVSDKTFATISKNKVYSDAFEVGVNEIPHIDLTKRNDLFLVVPASANVIAQMRCGLATDLLTDTLLASSCPIMIAPAMNTNMLQNKATQENLNILRDRGVHILDTECGVLACNTTGYGRMMEPEKILEEINLFFENNDNLRNDLSGKKILICAGPTVERIDPVRYLTNDSSGKTGVLISNNAVKRGAEVTLVHGPIDTEQLDEKVNKIGVESCDDMLAALKSMISNYDVLIMAAAPSDYRPINKEPQKHKKTSENEVFNLVLKTNPDILKTLSKYKNKNQIFIGFAAETENVIDNAKKKLFSKNLDYIVANDVSRKDIGFNSNYNEVTIISRDSERFIEFSTKEKIANQILDLII